MQQFSIYEIPTHRKLATPLQKTRTETRAVFTIENGSNGVPYTLENVLHSMQKPNPEYDSEVSASDQPEFISHKIGWHPKLDRSIVPHFSSKEAAVKFLIEEWGYASESHARQKHRHIKQHFDKFEQPIRRKGYDPTPIILIPKRMRSTLKMYQQRGMYRELETVPRVRLFHLHNHRRLQHNERMARQFQMGEKRRAGILA